MQILEPVRRSVGRIGFVVPRWTPEDIPDRQGVPFRCVTVAGALCQAGYEVVFCDQATDLGSGDRFADLGEAVRHVDVVFLWMNDLDPMIQTANALALAGRIKALNPAIRIAAGGSFITLCPAEFLQVDTAVDYFIRGYGEEAAVEFLAALAGRRPLEEVSGLVWNDGVWKANPIRLRQRFPPDSLEIYRQLDLRPFEQRGGIFGNGYGTLILGTGRGCAKRCRFCYWHNHPPSLLKARSIVDCVSYLRDRYGVRQFHFGELDFFTNRSRPLELAWSWRQRLPDCRWFALVSPEDAARYTEDEWRLLAEGGCRKLEFGTESGSAAMLERMGKRHRADAPYELTRTALRHGIEIMHNFIFGLVGETERDRQESLALIDRLHRLDPERVFFTFRFYQPVWNTPMGDEAIACAEDFPRSLEGVLSYRDRFGDPDRHEMKWISRREEKRIKRMVYYYLPIVTSKLRFSKPWLAWGYRGLREIGRLRLRARRFAFGWDRWLYDRLIMRPLDNTFTP